MTEISTPIGLPERNGRALYVAVRLFLAADAFVFLAFLFAYVYLRALDSDGMWHPSGIDPSVGLGLATALIMLAAAGAAFTASRRARSDTAGGLRWLVVGALVLASVLQAVQLFDPGYSPSASGAYGSVFIGFTATYLAHLLGALYWSETTAAAAARQPDADITASESDAVAAFVMFLAGVIVVAFILVYLV